MMTEKDADELLKRYLNGLANEQEVKWVEQWYKSLEHANEYPELDEVQRRDIIYTSYSKIQNRLRADRVKAMIRWPALAAAAAITIFATVYVNDRINNRVQSGNVEVVKKSVVGEQIENNTSSIKHIVLADSTQVSLQPSSSIRITDDFNQKDRRIVLNGEAFFSVSHNPSKPFYVEAGQVVTKVLGTSFKIKAFHTDDDITVEVRTGKVSVYRADKKIEKKDETPLVLTANQQAVFNNEEGVVTKSIVESPVILLTEQEVRRLQFEAAPMAEVMEAIEKAYGVEIIFSTEDFSTCKLTTTLGSDGIFKRLDIICHAIGATYAQEDGQIVITGKGCK